MKIINIQDLVAQDTIFKSAYNEILFKAFPNENELESLDNIKKFLVKANQQQEKDDNYCFLVALLDGKVVGCLVGDYFTPCNSAIIIYIATDENVMGKGISKTLLNHFYELQDKNSIQNGYSGVDYVFLECENPDKLYDNKEEGIKRINYWKHMGFSKINFSYIQAPLAETKSPIYFLDLYCCKKNNNLGAKVSRQVILDFIYNYQKNCFNIEDLNKNKYFIEMQKQNKSSCYTFDDQCSAN